MEPKDEETDNERIEALRQLLALTTEEALDQLEVSKYDENTIVYGKEEYLVVTDDEADKLWDDYLENYIDECIIPEVPSQYQGYFDREAWKKDAYHDGRAHSLSTYDGDEHEEEVEGTNYFIYRTN